MDKILTNIIFTKNRPLQLHAYLESFYNHFPMNRIDSFVLYKQDKFDEEYEKLFRLYPDLKVIRERNFYKDLLGLLENVSTEYMLFGIDDVVFFDSVDLDVIEQTFSQNRNEIFGFSLRLNPQYFANSADKINELVSYNQRLYKVNWTTAKNPNARYPFELCATIYPSQIVRKVVKNAHANNRMTEKIFAPGQPFIKALGGVFSVRRFLKFFGFFFNPNTFESWNCRYCRHHAKRFPQYLYFQKNCAIAMQVNVVNISTNTDMTGPEEYSIDALNEKYKQGFKLDITAFENNKPCESHCGPERFILIKS